MAKKTWIEKRDIKKSPVVKVLDKNFADMVEGEKMFIATPQLVDAYIRSIPFGSTVELSTMRKDLAVEHQADKTCPVTSGIFLRIVAEAAFEELNTGKKLDEITPFWRMIDPTSKVASKLTCGTEFIKQQRQLEIENS